MAEVQDNWSLERSGLLIAESTPSISVLRVARDDAKAAGRLGKVFGIDWPDAPNTVSGGAVRVAWMAPGQWAIFGSGEDLAGPVARACRVDLHHLADVSAGRRQWRIEGAHARDVLAKGCGIDTHPTVLPAQTCARTLLAQVPILMIVRSAGEAFEIIADVSFAGHLCAWFVEASLEFQP